MTKINNSLTPNALTVLQKRYLKKDKDGQLIETPADMFRRVAKNIAQTDSLHGASAEEIKHTEEIFYRVMTELEFLPNSPTLRGAGRRLQQLSGCFVLPIGDSIEEIHDTLKASTLVHKTGGGTGFAFSNLRPKGDIVASTGNIAGGPVSFMRIFNAVAQEITQGGVRMGANMGILSVHHPDIMQFITCKADGVSLVNFNISVAITDAFMKALEENEEYDLINPRTQEVVERIKASEVFETIVKEAWRTGDPGLIFIDTINRDHPVSHLGKIESTNPCGEQPLLPYESCNLGSINLAKMIKGNKVDWERLQKTVRTAVHFLDNVIDQNRYVLPEIEKGTKGTRKIGLGVMGFADMLIQLGIAYNSAEGLEIGEKVMEFISQEAMQKSVELAQQRGVFPCFEGSRYQVLGGPNVRNATRTTIAPTGTIGLIANASGGIEPIFAIVHKRETLFNNQGATETLLVVNEHFERVAHERGFYSTELMEKIAQTGSVQHLDEVPLEIRRVFVTAHDIAPEWHVKMQAAFQRHIDAAVSKTINFPNGATLEDVRKSYLLAYKLNCKGITIYRDGSRDFQVLHTSKKKEDPKTAPVSLQSKARPPILHGTTYRKITPIGTAYITVNANGGGAKEPFEVFINVGKAGSDVAADAEGLGRLISFILRMPSPLSSYERVQDIVGQLRGIGSGRQQGFGKQRIMSMPDALAQALAEHVGLSSTSELPGLPEDKNQARVGDLCSECGQATLVFEEGCKKCYNCGYSEC